MALLFGKQIWDKLKTVIPNEYGLAGLMGNLQAESGLIPYRVQGDFTDGYTTSLSYTTNVDNGAISEYEFVHEGPNGGGYGLAQWTFYTRKQKLYNKKVSMGVSIGSLNLGCEYLLEELSNEYPSVLNVLLHATSIRQASDKVLIDFESPGDTSESVQIMRANLGKAIYNAYSGGEIPIDPFPESPHQKMPFLLMCMKKR